MSDTDTVYLGRQPILDRNQTLVAYELLFRSGGENAARITDDTLATATVVKRAFSDMGLETAIGTQLGFINCDASFLLSDSVEMLPCDRIVLEILETVDPTPEVVARCRQLRERGFRLALDDYTGAEDRYRDFLAIVDFIKVDIQPLSPAEVEAVCLRLRPLGVALLAEKVDSREQAQHCHELGFQLFQGYFFARPTVLEGRRLEHNQLALIRLLGLVMGDSSTDALESAIKTEPALTVNLLRLVNSVGSGLRVKVQSLRQAITVLGRRPLQRWIQLLLFTRPGVDDSRNPLMIMAATRGRMMELIAESAGKEGRPLREEAFLAGIMSLMPALLAAPMANILDSLPISPGLRAALLAGEGGLGGLLTLVESLEDTDSAAFADALARFPELEATDVFAAENTAMAWASSLGKPATDN